MHVIRCGRWISLLRLCGIILMMALLCCGPVQAKGGHASVFSLQARNERLQDVLKKVSRATGYHIEITRGWENKPVTISLEKTMLPEAIGWIIRALGNPSHAVVTDTVSKRIEIRFFDQSGAYVSGKVPVGNENAEKIRQTHRSPPADVVEPPELVAEDIIPTD